VRHGGGGEGRGPDDRCPRGYEAGNAIEQLGDIGGHAGRRRKGTRILGRDAIDHREPGLDRGAVARIGLAGDRGREDDARFLLQAHKAVAPGRLIGTDIAAGDGDESSPFGKTRKRGSDVAHRGLFEAAFDMRRGGEGRVHQNHARPDCGIETVVDLLRVVPGDIDAAEQTEETGARVGNFVENEPRPGQLGEDRQQPRAGGWFQHDVGGSERGRLGRDEAERDRRRELLQLFGFLGPARLRRHPSGEAGEHVQHRGG
jgi:hypothetical protein